MTNSSIIYLDHAAATPLDDGVLGAMQPYFTKKFYNPSSLYLSAREVRSDIINSRERVARQLGCRPSEVIFTAGGTEANNLAIKGVMELSPSSNIVVSAVEHDSILEPARKYDCRRAKVNPDGYVNKDNLVELIDDNTVLVSIMYANNEVGTIQPIQEIATLIQGVRTMRQNRNITTPLYFHTDACQAANYLGLKLDVDMITLNGGKLYGPKQSGVLMVRSGINISPQILGGGQERGVRSGTENVAAIVGFSLALEKSQKIRSNETARLAELQKILQDSLLNTVEGIRINGSKNKLVNNIHITIPGIDNERLVMELDMKRVECAVGSACSASSDQPSHVLQAMGMSIDDISSSIRLSMGRMTTKDDVVEFVSRLRECL